MGAVMSLAKTLLKVAIGVAIAKGVSTLTKGAGSAKAEPRIDTAGRGTRLDTGTGSGSGGGLGDLMGDLLGGQGKNRSTGQSGGGDLLEQLTGTKRTTTRKNAPKGGMDGLLEQLTGGGAAKTTQTSGGGGLGDLLGTILGGAAAGGALGGALKPAEREQEISAALMLRAIIQAVKCDGNLDADEKKKLMEAMGDASQDEIKAVNAELSRPIDVEGLARMVPNGMEAQVYLASLGAINLDQQAEAQYLHSLAQALELSPQEVNALHDRAGVQHIYR
jgi:hypothetical protein